VLVAERESADFYETVLAKPPTRRATVNSPPIGNHELFDVSTRKAMILRARRCLQWQLAAIVDLIARALSPERLQKDLFEIVWQEGGDPRAHGRDSRHEASHRLGAIEKWSTRSSAESTRSSSESEPAAVQWFVGQVMKSSGGKADPKRSTSS